jgi:predicted esterase
MRRWISVILVSVTTLQMLPACAAAAAGWAQYNLNVTDPQTGQPTTTYALRYIPATLDQSKPAPVVIFFHGLGGNPDSYEFTLQPAADAAGCVVIAPSSIDFGWALPGDDQTVNLSLTQLQSELTIDQRRISVAGHSAGAAFAYLFSYDSLPSFSAIFTLSAPYYQVTGISDPAYTAPIRMYDGTADPNYTGGSFDALKAQWDALGVTHEEDVQAGYGHNGWPQSSMDAGFQFLVGTAYPQTTYGLTVVNGTGSGTYAAGASVPIVANAAPSGQVFDQWTGATVGDAHASSTTLVMPAAITTVTATYKAGPPPNHDPVIYSAAGAAPNPATVGASISFSATASDVDADLLTYTWTFGDGGSGIGAAVSHAYATAGTFSATVTITDGKGGSAISSASVVVQSSGGGGSGGSGGNGSGGTGGSGGAGGAGGSGGGGGDSDASGTGTIGGMAIPSTALPMSVSKFTASAKFSGGHDALSISGVIPGVPATFSPAGQTLTLNAGGAAVSFTLDAKGHGKSTQGMVALKLKGKRDSKSKTFLFSGGDVPFAARLQHGAWAQVWGLDPTASLKNASEKMNIIVEIGATVYGVTVTVLENSKPHAGVMMKK